MFSFEYQEISIAHKLDHASSPLDEYGKHMHSFYELLLFVRGDVVYSVESQRKVLEEGDFVLILPGQYHFASVNKDNLYERYVLKFPASMVPSSLQRRLREKNVHFFQKNRYIENIITNLDMCRKIFSDEDFFHMSKSKILETLIYLARIAETAENEFPDSNLYRILKYIRDHRTEELSVDRISKDLGLSKSYLFSYFKREMKVTLMKYIRSKKVIYGQYLIRQGKPPKEVAKELQFKDYSTFYRDYVSTFGYSPNKDMPKEE